MIYLDNMGELADGQQVKLNRRQIWSMAVRPKTLPAAAASVIVGSAAAFYTGNFNMVVAAATLVAALLLQIGANLANDVFDFRRGADARERLGPLRVTQAGLLTPRQVLAGMWIVFGLAVLLGAYLTIMGGWPVILIGMASILSAVAYTGGPFPFGYYGLGDLVVFATFGPVAVCGTYFIQTGLVDALAVWSSLPMGFLITAILVVNNLRDIESDRKAGKMTLAVRLGRRATRWEYLLCLAGSYLIPLAGAILGSLPVITLVTWLSIPLAVSLVRAVWRVTGRPLNNVLARTSKLTLWYALLFSLGLVLALFLPAWSM